MARSACDAVAGCRRDDPDHEPTCGAAASRAAHGSGPPETTSAAAKLAPEKLDINSAVLRNQLEEQIPRRLYAEAARCYHGGLQKDQRLDLSYRVHVADGEVSLSDLRTIEDTLEDSALERCIRERILATKWRDDAMPDLEEDDDLYMRVGGFQSYVASAEPAQPADHR